MVSKVVIGLTGVMSGTGKSTIINRLLADERLCNVAELSSIDGATEFCQPFSTQFLRRDKFSLNCPDYQLFRQGLITGFWLRKIADMPSKEKTDTHVIFTARFQPELIPKFFKNIIGREADGMKTIVDEAFDCLDIIADDVITVDFDKLYKGSEKLVYDRVVKRGRSDMSLSFEEFLVKFAPAESAKKIGVEIEWPEDEATLDRMRHSVDDIVEYLVPKILDVIDPGYSDSPSAKRARLV